MTYRKKLIEVALPLEAINKASAREKSIRHGHPSTLHLWWARRPLAACRAVIFASLVDDPGHHPEDHSEPITAPPEFIEACRKLPQGKNATGEDEKGRSNDTPRMRLFDFIETLVQWESTTDERVLETARELIKLATDGNPPPLLDPFSGGGSIPLEAQRLGLEAHASDLNPVAVMINKALIEIPPKFANMPPVNPRDRQGTAGTAGWKGAAGLAADVRYYGEWIRDKAKERIGHLYPDYNGETVIAWLWARTVKCPNPACGAQMPLVRSFELSKKKGRRAWVEPRVDPKTRQITFEVKQGNGKASEGTVNRQGATCVVCDTPVPFDHIREEGKAGRMNVQLMAIATEGQRGRSYYAPIPTHEQIADVPIPEGAPVTDLPVQALGFRVQLYGMTQHRDLFTPRQLTALTTFSDLVAETRQQIEVDACAARLPTDDTPLRDGGSGAYAYAEAISVYCAFGLDRSADYWSTIVIWHNGIKMEGLGHTFTRQTLQMTWDFAEGNPFSNSSGNWLLNLEWGAKCLEKTKPTLEGLAEQKDAQNLQNGNLAIVSTDPPYYDNIGYADLSDFFYVWLRYNLRNTYPGIFGTLLVPKDAELVATPARFNGDKDAAESHFENGLMRAFASMRRIIPVDYPLTVYYAFKQQELVAEEGAASTGWETMLEGLIQSGFSIGGTWPMRTEYTTSLKANINALASSIVLVCRPRPENSPMTSRREFVNELRQELPAALKEMQSGNIAPVDLAQASIGPGMAVYSRYSKVLEPNGDRLTVRTALQLINHELDAYLAEQEGDIDRDSRFAVAWFEQFGFKEAGFGQADVLARAKNTSVDGLVNAGVLESGAGKVKLLQWSELDPGWDPATDTRLTVWEATHHLILELDTRGEAGAAQLLAKMSPALAAEARQLAYRLYSLCERKGWADHARDYNALVISWSASQEQAAQLKDQYQQGALFE
jgi:putative DNA methylase